MTAAQTPNFAPHVLGDTYDEHVARWYNHICLTIYGNHLAVNQVNIRSERPKRVQAATWQHHRRVPAVTPDRTVVMGHRPPGSSPLAAALEPPAAPTAPHRLGPRRQAGLRKSAAKGTKVLRRRDEHRRVSRK